MDSDCWHGCFVDSWHGLLTPDSFSHPARFRRGLITRIVRHLLAEGLLRRGGSCLDCFGGVGCGGIVCADHDVNWFGVEIEASFVKMAMDNFALHRRRWGTSNAPNPNIIHGDSRQLTELVTKKMDALIASPPYGEARAFSTENGGGLAGSLVGKGSYPVTTSLPRNSYQKDEHGESPGQLANEHGDSFWEMSNLIVQQCFEVLRPGAVASWVCKEHARRGVVIDFPGQWLDLCLRCGFLLRCRHRAFLGNEGRNTTFLNGEEVLIKKSIGFFRRIQEKKNPAIAIDCEQVICVIKP